MSTNRIYSNKLVFLHRSGYLMVAAYCWPCKIELNTHFAAQRLDSRPPSRGGENGLGACVACCRATERIDELSDVAGIAVGG